MRRVLGDRYSGGAIAAVVAYCLVIQGLLLGYAQSATSQPGEAGTGFVICSATADTGSNEYDGSSGSDLTHNCCTGLCQFSCTFKVATRTCSTIAIDPDGSIVAIVVAPAVSGPPHFFASGNPEARGPPLPL